MRTRRSAAVFGGLALAVFMIALSPGEASARSVAPGAEQFADSQMAVFPGSQVSLHWSTAANLEFALKTIAPRALPDFDSPSVVMWPSPPGGTWNGTRHLWTSTATAVTLAIPAGTAGGTEYVLRLYTCSSSTQLCSNSRKRSRYSQVTLAVVGSNWRSVPYTADFPQVTVASGSDNGLPIDVAATPDGNIWIESEFSDALGELPAGTAAIATYVDPTDTATSPFAYCFSTCVASTSSELGERIVTAGDRIWLTEGGWEFYNCASWTGCPDNHSEIVSFDPATGHFCTYQVPGNDNEVFSIASTGTAPDNEIWFTETSLSHPYIDSFEPADVGDGCPGTSDESYSLNGDVRRIAWPANEFVPAQIAVDPSSPDLWVTDFWGSAVSEVDESTGQITNYPLVSHNSNSFFGPDPWQIYADSDYVYAIDFGDATLVRIDKSTGQTDYVALPLASDNEQGYGLAFNAGRLYFSLTGPSQPTFGGTSAIGYVDIASWEQASARCPPGVDCAPAPTSAVVYSGLFPVTDPSGVGSYSGIAAGPGGSLAIADYFSHQVVRLEPSG